MKAQYNVIRLMIKQSNINNHVKNLFYNSFIKMQNKNCVNVCICHKLFLLKFYTVSSQKLLCCGMPMQLPAVHIVGKDNGTTNTWSHKKHICQRHLDIILMYRVLSRVLAFLGFFFSFLFLQQYTHGTFSLLARDVCCKEDGLFMFTSVSPVEGFLAKGC